MWFNGCRMKNTVPIGIPIYIAKFNAMTVIPSPNTCASLPLSASDIIDKVEIIGVMYNLTASWKNGFSLSQSATVGANE